MGGDTNFKIPHYSQYTIKGIRELEWVQSELAARGLKDPWIRCGSCSIDKKCSDYVISLTQFFMRTKVIF